MLPNLLPIQDSYSSFVETLQRHNMVLLQAPPGAGKSTWLPLQLTRDKHFKHIVMLEPRRLAARNIASFLAQMQNEKLGESIGLRIRQERYVSKHTKLEIVTEGVLTRMLQNDHELSGIDCLIFDEFHERSIQADTALSFALESQAALREDLKIVLMSATLNAEKIQAKFNCPVITSEGRSYPIDEIYQTLRDENRWLDAIPGLIKKAISEQPGSCLVFLPGQREITRVSQQIAQQLTDLTLDKRIEVFSLYGEQTKAEQQSAIAPAPKGVRKIVLATNVAETSLTIEGIRIVVDSGKKRAAKFNLNTGVTELKTVSISKASATQRAGRAGRIEPGVVYRLGSKESFNRREKQDTPDILAADISALLLETKYWGSDLNNLALLDTPSQAQQQQAMDLLRMLQAVDAQNKITAHGKQLLELGTDIRWAQMLIKARELEPDYSGIRNLSVYLLALLESRVSKQAELSSALQSQLNAPLPLFKKQLAFWLKRLNLKPSKSLPLSLLPIAIALGYPDRLAKRRGQGYQLANGAGVDSRDDHWLTDKFIAIAELGGQQGKRIFSATAVDINQLQEAVPHLFQQKEVCEFIEKTGRFSYENRLMLGAILVSKKPINTTISEEVRTSAWLNIIQRSGFSMFNDFSVASRKSNNKQERSKRDFAQLLTRMTLAHRHFPEEYPAISEQQLLDTLDTWLAPFLRQIKNLEQLKRLSLMEPLKNCLDWNQQTALNTLLPTHLKVASGSIIPITYQLEGPASLSVRMQEVYGMTTTPEMCKGKVSLLMDLLSPARRSLQLTQDLQGFWKGSYQAIQKEMKGRYPRHFWPDNPESAKATTKTKAKM